MQHDAMQSNANLAMQSEAMQSNAKHRKAIKPISSNAEQSNAKLCKAMLNPKSKVKHPESRVNNQ